MTALYLWCLGFATVTFDLAFTFELAGFTIKSYYFAFLASALCTLPGVLRRKELNAVLKSLLSPPWIFAFALFLYAIGTAHEAEIPKKAVAYSAWLLFDIVIVAILGAVTIRALPREQSTRILRHTMTAATMILSLVLLVDHIAYFQGYKSGLIGYNQDRLLNWGVSRPHAFAYEPSYMAMFFSLALPFLFSWFIQKGQRGRDRLLAGAALSFTLVSLFLLSSRLGWAAAVLSLSLHAFLERSRLPKRLILASLGTALLVVGISIAISPRHQADMINYHLISGMVTGKDGSGYSRLYFIKQSVAALEQSSYYGVGLGGSFSYVQRMHGIDPPYDMGAEAIMSIWAQLLAELGIFGVACYLAFSYWLIRGIIRTSRDMPLRNALLVSCAIFFLFTAHWVGNVARTDVWVWITLWSAFAHFPSEA